MANTKFNDLNCSVADALQLIGEWWTILIIREAFFGTRRFEDFQQQLGIARNILTVRLRSLCEKGILVRVPIKEGARRHEYKLTNMGHDLLPTIIAIGQWGDRWLHEESGAPVKYLERSTGQEIEDIVILSSEGCQLSEWDLQLVPGEGANTRTIERLKKLELDWQTSRDEKRKRIMLKDNI